MGNRDKKWKPSTKHFRFWNKLSLSFNDIWTEIYFIAIFECYRYYRDSVLLLFSYSRSLFFIRFVSIENCFHCWHNIHDLIKWWRYDRRHWYFIFPTFIYRNGRQWHGISDWESKKVKKRYRGGGVHTA